MSTPPTPPIDLAALEELAPRMGPFPWRAVEEFANECDVIAGEDNMVEFSDPNIAKGVVVIVNALPGLLRLLREGEAERERLIKERDEALLWRRCADMLADEVAVLVRLRIVDSRSRVADALLDYREPPSTPRADRLAAAESRAAALETEVKALTTNRDEWRGKAIDMMVTGRYPAGPHDDDPEFQELKRAAEYAFHGTAYAAKAKEARALAAEVERLRTWATSTFATLIQHNTVWWSCSGCGVNYATLPAGPCANPLWTGESNRVCGGTLTLRGIPVESPPAPAKDAGGQRPVAGKCICGDLREQHANGNGCTACGRCPFFRQEDEISIGLASGALVIQPEHEEVVPTEATTDVPGGRCISATPGVVAQSAAAPSPFPAQPIPPAPASPTQGETSAGPSGNGTERCVECGGWYLAPWVLACTHQTRPIAPAPSPETAMREALEVAERILPKVLQLAEERLTGLGAHGDAYSLKIEGARLVQRVRAALSPPAAQPETATLAEGIRALSSAPGGEK